jgi:hydrogenase maturation protease
MTGEPWAEPPVPTTVRVRGTEVGRGSRVRLRPARRADAFDMFLDGKLATVESVEQDFEGRVHLAVTVDDDPGHELGADRQIGHRFFFTADEVEPLPRARLLIAGVGNIFRGDDAFGCETARRLAARVQHDEIRVKDFGTRGFDLACALVEGYDGAILIDAVPRGRPPGTLYVIEPEPHAITPNVDPHGLTPEHVLRLAAALGTPCPWLRVLGCEPASVGSDDEGAEGLSGPVAAAVDEAVAMAEQLAREFLCGRA